MWGKSGEKQNGIEMLPFSWFVGSHSCTRYGFMTCHRGKVLQNTYNNTHSEKIFFCGIGWLRVFVSSFREAVTRMLAVG